MVATSRRSARLYATAVVAVVVLVGLVALGRRSADPRSVSSADAESAGPEACVERMMRAARDGDVPTFLDCYGDPLRTMLEQRTSQLSPDRAAAELQSRFEGLTGFVLLDRQLDGEQEASLVLERIFTHEKQRYRLRLRKFGGRWRIVAEDPIDAVKLEIPVGTPVVPGIGDGTDKESTNGENAEDITAPGDITAPRRRGDASSASPAAP